jgi:hypothetical protein
MNLSDNKQTNVFDWQNKQEIKPFDNNFNYNQNNNQNNINQFSVNNQ